MFLRLTLLRHQLSWQNLHKSLSLFSAAVGPCKLEGVDNVIPMSAETGRLFRPEYPPGTPPRGIMCTWVITVPEGQFVKLRLNNIELGTVCRKYSVLAIRDGQSTSSPLVKSFCSYDIGPMSFFSSGRHIWVRFQSPKQDWSDHLWFTAEFEAVKQCKVSVFFFNNFY